MEAVSWSPGQRSVCPELAKIFLVQMAKLTGVAKMNSFSLYWDSLWRPVIPISHF